jgi:hypothetical protein
MIMRTQVTAYLHPETKKWLTKYASIVHFNESEVLRLLVEREQRIEWLLWSLQQKDPAQERESPIAPPPEQAPSGRSEVSLPNSTIQKRNSNR